VFWRAKVVDVSQNELSYIRVGVQGNDRLIEKTVVTDYRHKRFSPVKGKWSFWSGMLSNAEGFLPHDALFKSILIDYNRASYPFFLWSVDAIILYFILMLIFTFAFKSFFKVTI